MADPFLTEERVEKKYYVQASEFEYLYSHTQTPGSLVVSATNERDRQGQSSATPKNEEAKRLDLFRRNVYSTGSIQFRISNQQVLLGRYNFNLWDSMDKFKDSLLKQLRQEFMAILEEGKIVARASLQAALDATDCSQKDGVGSCHETLFVAPVIWPLA